jgi:hypothetical protein
VNFLGLCSLHIWALWHSLRALDVNIYVSRIVVNSSIYVSGPKYFQLVARHKRYMRDGLDEDSYEMDLCILKLLWVYA